MRENYIAFSYKRTKNLGNFESITAELTVQAHVDEDEDCDQCIYFLQEKTKQSVRDFIDLAAEPEGSDQFDNIQSKRKVAGMEVFNGNS